MKQTNKRIILLNDVESTNNYANHLVLSNAAEEGTVVLARFQKSGRGQAGNSWESQSGMNLLASIILYPKLLQAGKQFQISKLVSLSIVEFLEKEIGSVSIKWPNDIYVGEKKIAGILIENSIKGQNLFSSVIGIGLNLNQEKFVSDAPNPVSLKQLTGRNYDVETVLDEILTSLFARYEKLKSGNFQEIDAAYLSGLFRMNEWAKFRKQNELFEARIIGIGEFGQLQQEDRNGKISEFMFKEIEFVL